MEAILDEVYLRHSGKGHVRFSVPAALCTETAAARLERGLVLEEGVYRVRVYRPNLKLSVQFREDATDLKAISARLGQVVGAIPPEDLIEPEPEPEAERKSGARPGIKDRVSAELVMRLLKSRKGKGGLGSAVHKASLPTNLVIDKETERKLTLALNELVLFYLIKLHWEVITTRLIKRPLHNLGPWLSLSYLLFLYVRHKKEA